MEKIKRDKRFETVYSGKGIKSRKIMVNKIKIK